jgi:hypothetical protein
MSCFVPVHNQSHNPRGCETPRGMRRVFGHQLPLGARDRVIGASGRPPHRGRPCPGDVDPDPALGAAFGGYERPKTCRRWWSGTNQSEKSCTGTRGTTRNQGAPATTTTMARRGARRRLALASQTSTPVSGRARRRSTLGGRPSSLRHHGFALTAPYCSIPTDGERLSSLGAAPRCRSPVPSTAGRRFGRRRAPSTESSFSLAVTTRARHSDWRATGCAVGADRRR